MLGETSTAEGVLADFLTPMLPNIGGEPTIEALIKLHMLISRNVASMIYDLRGGLHRHLTLTMTVYYYIVQKGYTFLSYHNHGNYPTTIGTNQEKYLRTKRFQQNQTLFRRCTALDRALKKQIVTAVQPVLLSPLVDHLTGFGQVTALQMLQHIFNSHGAIY